MAQNSFSHKSAFSDFSILYSHFNGYDEYSSKKVSDALDGIREAYGLEGKELQLVTHLAHIIPNGLLIKKIADILGLQDGDYGMAIIDPLQKKKFIRTCITTSGQSFITFTSDAIKAFNNYEPFGALPEVDFIEMIRKTSMARLSTAAWINMFKQELDSHRTSDFAMKFITLGASELSDDELSVFCFMLRYFIRYFTKPWSGKPNEPEVGIHIDDVANGPSKTQLESLVQKGLVVSKDEGYIIAPKVADFLLSGHDEIVNYEEISTRAQVIKSTDIEKKELFFSPESQEEIDHLYFMLSKDGFEHARSVLLKKKRTPAIQSLLWGGPGTGKTETVKQIAKETGRDIFLFDVAKVTASEWGATENLYRKLFMAYRYIVAVKSLTPILLFNEADQVLSKRLEGMTQAMEKSENIVTNLLLQEFEDMHGILLATTNNIKILDVAFDRRFLFKTELQKPDARARKSIWKSMIPELSDAEAELLAEKYVMSGAQINNVATKRDLAELYFLGDRGLSYIETLCDKELNTEKLNPTIRHIGF